MHPEHLYPAATIGAAAAAGNTCTAMHVGNGDHRVTAMDPHIGPWRMQGNPIKLSAYDDPPTRRPAPDLDADRAAILKELGL